MLGGLVLGPPHRTLYHPLCPALHESALHDDGILLSAHTPDVAVAAACIVGAPSSTCSGQVTEPNQGYETLYVFLGNVQVGQSDGSSEDCLNPVSTSSDPSKVPALLQPGASVTIKLTVDSQDGVSDGG